MDYFDAYELLTSPLLFIQLTMCKRAAENKSSLYDLDGSETLGSSLRIKCASDAAPPLSKCSIQWYRMSSDCSWKQVITGKHFVLDLDSSWIIGALSISFRFMNTRYSIIKHRYRGLFRCIVLPFVHYLV